MIEPVFNAVWLLSLSLGAVMALRLSLRGVLFLVFLADEALAAARAPHSRGRHAMPDTPRAPARIVPPGRRGATRARSEADSRVAA